MGIIELLWNGDMDEGVVRDMFEPNQRRENQQQQHETPASQPSASQPPPHFDHTYIVDDETGELMQQSNTNSGSFGHDPNLQSTQYDAEDDEVC